MLVEKNEDFDTKSIHSVKSNSVKSRNSYSFSPNMQRNSQQIDDFNNIGDQYDAKNVVNRSSINRNSIGFTKPSSFISKKNSPNNSANNIQELVPSDYEIEQRIRVFLII